MLLHDLEPRKKKTEWGKFKKSKQITTSKKKTHDFHQDHPANQDYGPDWDRLKREVKERDGWKCKNCKKQARTPTERKEMHAHHIISLSKGGKNIKSNLLVLCRECHRRLHRGNKWL